MDSSRIVGYRLVEGLAARSKAESLVTLAMVGKCGSGIIWLEDGWNVISVGRGIVVCKDSSISQNEFALLLTLLQFDGGVVESFTDAEAATLLVPSRG